MRTTCLRDLSVLGRRSSSVSTTSRTTNHAARDHVWLLKRTPVHSYHRVDGLPYGARAILLVIMMVSWNGGD